MTASKQPMAFYHEDGIVPSWNFAMKYAGVDGHIATLPEIIEARLATKPGDEPWETYYVTSSAEYYGIGANGREKLIVAHGVGPMATLEGIKQAYSWQYKDKSRRRDGGRISAEEFLKLESGHYGEVQAFNWSEPLTCNVQVIDLKDYLESWEDAFYGWRNPFSARLDRLLWARLGPLTSDYVSAHARHALKWHEDRSVKLPSDGKPMIIYNKGASNCTYDTSPEVDGRFDWSRRIPRPLEQGKAIAHLLGTQGLMNMHCNGWQGLTTEFFCHEWSNGVRFVGVPDGATWEDGLVQSPQPHNLLRREWRRFASPNEDAAYIPPRLHLLEHTAGEWFTRYPKYSDGERMDESDVEFHVNSVRPLGDPQQFKTDDDFFLRYNLSQVIALAIPGANAYEITDLSTKDSAGFTTVTVQFYEAVVDISQRLPRVKEIKQDYDLLMG